jgi:hypothetical protein
LRYAGFYERLRPRALASVVGNDKAAPRSRNVAERQRRLSHPLAKARDGLVLAADQMDAARRARFDGNVATVPPDTKDFGTGACVAVVATG